MRCSPFIALRKATKIFSCCDIKLAHRCFTAQEFSNAWFDVRVRGLFGGNPRCAVYRVDRRDMAKKRLDVYVLFRCSRLHLAATLITRSFRMSLCSVFDSRGWGNMQGH